MRGAGRHVEDVKAYLRTGEDSQSLHSSFSPPSAQMEWWSFLMAGTQRKRWLWCFSVAAIIHPSTPPAVTASSSPPFLLSSFPPSCHKSSRLSAFGRARNGRLKKQEAETTATWQHPQPAGSSSCWRWLGVCVRVCVCDEVTWCFSTAMWCHSSLIFWPVIQTQEPDSARFLLDQWVT